MSDATGLKIIFAGTPDFAATHLQALIDSPHEVISVYTQPDRPAGRGKKLTPSPVKVLAQEADIAVYQPQSLKTTNDQRALAQQRADIMVVVAYGLLLPKVVLDTPPLGCINVHASLLPRWRGAAPIQRAIEAGDSLSGVTIMQMDEGLDTGDMLYTQECPIHPTDTATDLHDRLAASGPKALLVTLEQLRTGRATPVKQDDALATYASKLTKQEAHIDWRLNAGDIVRKVNAYNPFPVAYTLLGKERLRILRAHVSTQEHHTDPGTLLSCKGTLIVACGKHSALEITQLQLPGKKAMDTQAALNGFSALFEAQAILASATSQ